MPKFAADKEPMNNTHIMNINVTSLFAFALAAVSLAVLPSCGNTQAASDKPTETVSDTAPKDTAAAIADTSVTAEANDEAADAKVVEDFLNKLYKNYVFGSRDFAKVKSQFAGSIVKRLRAEYEFDGGGYAVWLFRTANQDGASDKSEVKSVSAEGDGWYTVRYSDMGNAGSTRFKVTVTDGTAYVEDFTPDKSHR